MAPSPRLTKPEHLLTEPELRLDGHMTTVNQQREVTVAPMTDTNELSSSATSVSAKTDLGVVLDLTSNAPPSLDTGVAAGADLLLEQRFSHHSGFRDASSPFTTSQDTSLDFLPDRYDTRSVYTERRGANSLQNTNKAPVTIQQPFRFLLHQNLKRPQPGDDEILEIPCPSAFFLPPSKQPPSQVMPRMPTQKQSHSLGILADSQSLPPPPLYNSDNPTTRVNVDSSVLFALAMRNVPTGLSEKNLALW